jgi:hypothetical protein
MLEAKNITPKAAQKIAENITVPQAIRRPQPGQVAACFDT